MKTVLLTGFEPFGGEKVNPSWLAVRRLHGRVIRGHRVVAKRLPTVFGESLSVLLKHLEAIKPVLVICVGQAGGRAEITVERVAINISDSNIADNAGHKPKDTPVIPGAPVAYWSTLPVKTIVHELRRCGIPSSVSQTAGTFVCNHVFYGLEHALGRINAAAPSGPGYAPVRGGFVHVPFLPEQTICAHANRSVTKAGMGAAKHTGQPSMALPMMVEALTIAVRESLRPHPKIHLWEPVRNGRRRRARKASPAKR